MRTTLPMARRRVTGNRSGVCVGARTGPCYAEAMRSRDRCSVSFALAVCALASVARAKSAAPPEGPAAPLAGQVHALLINGGGNASMNYRSHMEHLRSMVAMLRARGVAPERISVFSADGANPGLDLKVRDEAPEEEAWILVGTRAWEALRPRTRFVDGKLDGVELHPATRTALQIWFSGKGRRIPARDTLIVYVTDHGTENKADRSNNHIVLWGKDERLSVGEMGELLDILDPGVRVVSLMSQCYSGAFARLMYGPSGSPGGRRCGFYSTSEDRRAYGCYPDVRESEGMGYSDEIIGALGHYPELATAHDATTLLDDTPDVPMTTSDRFLEDRLAARAKNTKQVADAIAEEWLARAWQRKADFEPEIRRLDAIAQQFGTSSPRSFAELAKDRAALQDVHHRLEEYERLWVATLDATRDESLGRLLSANAEWKRRLGTDATSKLGDADRQATRRALAQALTSHARGEKDTWGRIETLRRRATAAHEARYRLEVRLAALFRLRRVLLFAAGRALVEDPDNEGDRAALAALLECERSMPPATNAPLPPPVGAPTPLPAFEADRAVLVSIWPSWLGISYRQPTKAMRERWKLPSGGAFVDQVLPGTPAEQAGVRAGDIVLGPKGGARFREQHEVREWVMLAPPGQAQILELLRDGAPVEVTLDLKPHPADLPKLPGPPPVGAAAPPLSLGPARGQIPRLGAGKAVMLFYWATWCKPCKDSVPDLLTLAAKRGFSVVAITDEPQETVDEFLRTRKDPFPEIVAIDEMRTSFRAHGVSGTPTFVLIDARGNITARKVGYDPAKPLLD